MFAMRPLLLAFFCAACLTVSGCGIKGPLYLPKEPAQPAPGAARDAAGSNEADSEAPEEAALGIAHDAADTEIPEVPEEPAPGTAP